MNATTAAPAAAGPAAPSAIYDAGVARGDWNEDQENHQRVVAG